MAQDLERLFVSFEADIRGFQKSMEKLGLEAGKRMRDIDNSIKGGANNLNRSMEDLGRGMARSFGKVLGTSLRGGIATILGVVVVDAVRAMREQLKTIADLGSSAQFSGVGLKQYQSLQQAAADNGASPAAMGELLNGIAKAANDATHGENEFLKILAANNIALKDNQGNLRSTMSLLSDYADLIANAKTEQDKLLLLGAIGAGGKDAQGLADFLSRGGFALREMTKEIEKTGSLIDSEMVKKAAELDAAFASMWQTFATSSRVAIYEALKGLGNLMQKAWDFLDVIPGKIPSSAAGKAGAAIGAQGGALLMGGTAPGSANPYGTIGSPSFGGMTAAGSREAALAEIRKKLGGRGTTVIPDKAAGGGAAEKADEFDREQKRMERSIRNLGAEAQAIGKTTYEGARLEAQFRLLDAAQQAGIPITQEVTDRIDKLSVAYAQAKNNLAEVQLAQRQWVDLQNFGGEQLISVLGSAKDGMDGLKRATLGVVDAIQQAVLQALILGKGPLAGLLGTGTTSNGGVGGLVGMLFGGLGIGGASGGGGSGSGGGGGYVPSFDVGGRVPGPAGRAMPAIVHGGEIILNAAQQRAVASRMAGGGSVDNSRTYQIDARGAQVGVAEQIKRALIAYDSDLPNRLNDRQMRGI